MQIDYRSLMTAISILPSCAGSECYQLLDLRALHLHQAIHDPPQIRVDCSYLNCHLAPRHLPDYFPNQHRPIAVAKGLSLATGRGVHHDAHSARMQHRRVQAGRPHDPVENQ